MARHRRKWRHSLIVRLATRFILQQLLRNMYADLWRMEHLIKASGIDWTIVRPPRLVDKPATGNYRMAIDTFSDRGMVISRSDVAGFVIDQLSNPAIIKRTVEVYEGKGTAA